MILRGRKRVAQEAIDPFPRGQHLRTFNLVRQFSVGIDDFPGRDVDPKIIGGEA